MANDPWSSPAPFERATTTESAFMGAVYRWMALGLTATGLVAWMVANSETALRTIFGNRGVFYALLIAQFLMVMAFNPVVRNASFGVASAMFVAYCALTGVTMSAIFIVYTQSSIAQVFFITAGTFLGMSAYGTLTKADLSSWGSFLFMGLWGIVLAGVVNLFIGSDALSFVLSCADVVVFTGLTAYDTQKIRGWAAEGNDKLALSGALELYLDFINLFLSLLRLLGRRR